MQKDISQFFKTTNKKNIKKDDNIQFRPDIYVFTDGACQNNGKPNAAASWAVFFDKNDPRNASQLIIGKQTNQNGELEALLNCF